MVFLSLFCHFNHHHPLSHPQTRHSLSLFLSLFLVFRQPTTTPPFDDDDDENASSSPPPFAIFSSLPPPGRGRRRRCSREETRRRRRRTQDDRDDVRVVVLFGGDVDGECDDGVDNVGRRSRREKRRRNRSAVRDDGDDDREIRSKVTQRRPPRFLSLWRNQTSRANETIHGIDRRTHTENRAR